MDLKRTFIMNVKNYRKKEGISPMLLAERCNTSTSYIGEIEIGRKFPSAEMIERIAQALLVTPYRLFMPGEDAPKDETEDFLKGLPRRVWGARLAWPRREAQTWYRVDRLGFEPRRFWITKVFWSMASFLLHKGHANRQ
jgi:transcriptional regulator with XRE-family HTH domain